MQTGENVVGSDHLFNNRRFSVDDTLLYVGLIRTVLEHCTTIVDVGCGRGSYADDDSDPHNLFDLRGPGRAVLGIDVDPAAATNPFVTEFRRIIPGEPWPVDSNSVDLVVSDWTLEHIEEPEHYVREVRRILHVGGLFIARSINRRSVLSTISRSVPNRRHAAVLGKAQPARSEIDVFPAHYRMNTPKRLRQLFGDDFEFSIASRPGLENYLRAQHPYVASAVASAERRLPESMQTAFVMCARLTRA